MTARGIAVNPLFVKLCIPDGLEEALEGLAREVLRRQPTDIKRFAAAYFHKLLAIRTEAENCGAQISLVNLINRGRFLDVNEDDMVGSTLIKSHVKSTPEVTNVNGVENQENRNDVQGTTVVDKVPQVNHGPEMDKEPALTQGNNGDSQESENGVYLSDVRPQQEHIFEDQLQGASPSINDDISRLVVEDNGGVQTKMLPSGNGFEAIRPLLTSEKRIEKTLYTNGGSNTDLDLTEEVEANKINPDVLSTKDEPSVAELVKSKEVEILAVENVTDNPANLVFNDEVDDKMEILHKEINENETDSAENIKHEIEKDVSTIRDESVPATSDVLRSEQYNMSENQTWYDEGKSEISPNEATITNEMNEKETESFVNQEPNLLNTSINALSEETLEKPDEVLELQEDLSKIEKESELSDDTVPADKQDSLKKKEIENEINGESELLTEHLNKMDNLASESKTENVVGIEDSVATTNKMDFDGDSLALIMEVKQDSNNDNLLEFNTSSEENQNEGESKFPHNKIEENQSKDTDNTYHELVNNEIILENPTDMNDNGVNLHEDKPSELPLLENDTIKDNTELLRQSAGEMNSLNNTRQNESETYEKSLKMLEDNFGIQMENGSRIKRSTDSQFDSTILNDDHQDNEILQFDKPMNGDNVDVIVKYEEDMYDDVDTAGESYSKGSLFDTLDGTINEQESGISKEDTANTVISNKNSCENKPNLICNNTNINIDTIENNNDSPEYKDHEDNPDPMIPAINKEKTGIMENDGQKTYRETEDEHGDNTNKSEALTNMTNEEHNQMDTHQANDSLELPLENSVGPMVKTVNDEGEELISNQQEPNQKMHSIGNDYISNPENQDANTATNVIIQYKENDEESIEDLPLENESVVNDDTNGSQAIIITEITEDNINGYNPENQMKRTAGDESMLNDDDLNGSQAIIITEVTDDYIDGDKFEEPIEGTVKDDDVVDLSIVVPDLKDIRETQLETISEEVSETDTEQQSHVYPSEEINNNNEIINNVQFNEMTVDAAQDVISRAIKTFGTSSTGTDFSREDKPLRIENIGINEENDKAEIVKSTTIESENSEEQSFRHESKKVENVYERESEQEDKVKYKINKETKDVPEKTIMKTLSSDATLDEFSTMTDIHTKENNELTSIHSLEECSEKQQLSDELVTEEIHCVNISQVDGDNLAVDSPSSVTLGIEMEQTSEDASPTCIRKENCANTAEKDLPENNENEKKEVDMLLVTEEGSFTEFISDSAGDKHRRKLSSSSNDEGLTDNEQEIKIETTFHDKEDIRDGTEEFANETNSTLPVEASNMQGDSHNSKINEPSISEAIITSDHFLSENNQLNQYSNTNTNITDKAWATDTQEKEKVNEAVDPEKHTDNDSENMLNNETESSTISTGKFREDTNINSDSVKSENNDKNINAQYVETGLLNESLVMNESYDILDTTESENIITSNEKEMDAYDKEMKSNENAAQQKCNNNEHNNMPPNNDLNVIQEETLDAAIVHNLHDHDKNMETDMMGRISDRALEINRDMNSDCGESTTAENTIQYQLPAQGDDDQMHHVTDDSMASAVNEILPDEIPQLGNNKRVTDRDDSSDVEITPKCLIDISESQEGKIKMNNSTEHILIDQLPLKELNITETTDGSDINVRINELTKTTESFDNLNSFSPANFVEESLVQECMTNPISEVLEPDESMNMNPSVDKTDATDIQDDEQLANEELENNLIEQINVKNEINIQIMPSIGLKDQDEKSVTDNILQASNDNELKEIMEMKSNNNSDNTAVKNKSFWYEYGNEITPNDKDDVKIPNDSDSVQQDINDEVDVVQHSKTETDDGVAWMINTETIQETCSNASITNALQQTLPSSTKEDTVTLVLISNVEMEEKNLQPEVTNNEVIETSNLTKSELIADENLPQITQDNFAITVTEGVNSDNNSGSIDELYDQDVPLVNKEKDIQESSSDAGVQNGTDDASFKPQSVTIGFEGAEYDDDSAADTKTKMDHDLEPPNKNNHVESRVAKTEATFMQPQNTPTNNDNKITNVLSEVKNEYAAIREIDAETGEVRTLVPRFTESKEIGDNTTEEKNEKIPSSKKEIVIMEDNVQRDIQNELNTESEVKVSLVQNSPETRDSESHVTTCGAEVSENAMDIIMNEENGNVVGVNFSKDGENILKDMKRKEVFSDNKLHEADSITEISRDSSKNTINDTILPLNMASALATDDITTKPFNHLQPVQEENLCNETVEKPKSATTLETNTNTAEGNHPSESDVQLLNDILEKYSLKVEDCIVKDDSANDNVQTDSLEPVCVQEIIASDPPSVDEQLTQLIGSELSKDT